MATVVQQMPAFQHEFYTIAIRKRSIDTIPLHEIDSAHHQEILLQTPAQTLSWDMMPDWDGFYLMFTQSFMANSDLLRQMPQQLPFLALNQAVSIGITRQELQLFHGFFEQIAAEYYGNKDDNFQFIESYVHLLLLHINRCHQNQ